MSLRGILRGFGPKVGPTTPARFEERIRELVAGHPSLEAIAQSLLAVRVGLRSEFARVEKQVLAMARCDTRARLLMSVLEMRPSMSVSPDWYLVGVRPK
jgi:transposase